MKNIRPANFEAAAVVELVELMLATFELVGTGTLHSIKHEPNLRSIERRGWRSRG